MPPKLRSLPGQGDEFFRSGVWRRRIDERSRNADGAIPHRLSHQSAHLFELIRVRLFVLVAQNHSTNLGRADKGGKIDAEPLLLNARKVLAERPPVGSDMVMRVITTVGLDDGIVQWRNRTTLASDFSGNALENFRRKSRLSKNR